MEKLKLTILIPYILGDDYAYFLSRYVEKVIFPPEKSEIENFIRDNDFDVTLEWQYGHQDHTVLDLVEKYNKKARVILCLNWNGKLPADFNETDYFAYVDTPFTLQEMLMLFEKAKKSLLN